MQVEAQQARTRTSASGPVKSNGRAAVGNSLVEDDDDVGPSVSELAKGMSLDFDDDDVGPTRVKGVELEFYKDTGAGLSILRRDDCEKIGVNGWGLLSDSKNLGSLKDCGGPSHLLYA
ncbi:hypothetical protein GNI_053900 [Gregarina niphandrodes]|uniref:Uncharacterized protein n=1 Tax=Gregarina niphandrodes TaxID=110365 RepID=A0A023B922_GRENI|nr:hypothetical protein GNI_053900 [Gregarina niphandrodes]EZG70941.1 hypothetical protein GNI_053900 [Gregarina niphandrodes]|eukprot:XP_011129856.1 hypothetical protein GNI_053900 [Gregarina niphandrodes]